MKEKIGCQGSHELRYIAGRSLKPSLTDRENAPFFGRRKK